MNHKEYLVEKLKQVKMEQIKLSVHANIRRIQRQIDSQEIVENIINPHRLEYAFREESYLVAEDKFECYFAYSDRMCHKYVLAIGETVTVVTVMKMGKSWRRVAEQKLRCFND